MAEPITWQPVDSLPEEGLFLGWTYRGEPFVGRPFQAFGPTRDCLIDGRTGRWTRITHWAPIAKPPTWRPET